MPPGRLRAAAVRSPAAAVCGGRSRRLGGGARDPARRSASGARPGDRVRPLAARRASRARARRPGRAPRARGAPRPGATALAVGGLGRPAVPDVDRALRRRAAGGHQARARGPRLRAGPPAPRPAGRGASRPRRRCGRGAHVRLRSRGRSVGRARRAALRGHARPGGWTLGSPRRFDAEAPLASASERPIGWWLEAESVHARLRRGDGRPVLSARRCAARRARSGTPA